MMKKQKPLDVSDVRVLIWVLDEHVPELLNGNFDVVWCEERKDLQGTWNHFVQLSVLPDTYIQLKRVGQNDVDMDSDQLKIPFNNE